MTTEKKTITVQLTKEQQQIIENACKEIEGDTFFVFGYTKIKVFM